MNGTSNIIFLGTGNALATRCFNTCFIIRSRGNMLMVDAGGGNGILRVLDAARLAEQLSVKNLILYHTEDRTLSTRRERYTAEAKTVFHGNVFVPEDTKIIQIG